MTAKKVHNYECFCPSQKSVHNCLSCLERAQKHTGPTNKFTMIVMSNFCMLCIAGSSWKFIEQGLFICAMFFALCVCRSFLHAAQAFPLSPFWQRNRGQLHHFFSLLFLSVLVLRWIFWSHDQLKGIVCWQLSHFFTSPTDIVSPSNFKKIQDCSFACWILQWTETNCFHLESLKFACANCFLIEIVWCSLWCQWWLTVLAWLTVWKLRIFKDAAIKVLIIFCRFARTMWFSIIRTCHSSKRTQNVKDLDAFCFLLCLSKEKLHLSVERETKWELEALLKKKAA